MKKLSFDRVKYGKQLLIDAAKNDEIEIVSDTLVLDFYTLVFFEKTAGTYQIDSELINLENNMVLFIRPGQINKVDKTVFDRCTLLFFEGEFLDTFFNDRYFIHKFGIFHNPDLPSFLKLEPTTFKKYHQFAGELHSEIKNLNRDSEHLLRSIIYYLLVRLNQDYAQKHGRPSYTIGDHRLLKFLSLLRQRVRENKNVQDYASEIGISRVLLNKICQGHFSKTAHQIIRENKLAELQKDILHTDKTFSMLAYEYGFSAPSHLSRFVKQMTGRTPQELKENYVTTMESRHASKPH